MNTATPSLDAAHDYELRQIDYASIADAEEAAADEIRRSFALLGKVPMKMIAVPCAGLPHGVWKVSAETLESVCLDVICEGSVNAELIAVLEHSDCELVKKLYAAICEKWIFQQAGNIAEARI